MDFTLTKPVGPTLKTRSHFGIAAPIFLLAKLARRLMEIPGNSMLGKR